MPPQGNPGMSQEIMQAMQRRAMGAGAPQLQQVSPQARAGQPIPQPVPQGEVNQAAAPQQARPQKFQPQDRRDLIIMALIEQLKLDNKLESQGGTPPMSNQFGMGGGTQDFVSHKMPILMHEGYPQRQASAIAYSMARKNQGGGNPEYGQGGSGDIRALVAPLARKMKGNYGLLNEEDIRRAFELLMSGALVAPTARRMKGNYGLLNESDLTNANNSPMNQQADYPYGNNY